MRDEIEIDLFDTTRDGTVKFLRLLDRTNWDVLKAKIEDPDNKKNLNELITEMLEGV